MNKNDAISKLKDNKKLIEKILRMFPNINFLLDAGFTYPIEVYNYNYLLEKRKLTNYSFVLGTESIKNYRIKDLLQKQNFFFSIDFNGSETKWIKKFYLERARLNLIFMFVKSTGGRGVNYNFLKKFKGIVSKNNCLFAGGVKNKDDLRRLNCIGFRGVVVSDMIHKKIVGSDFAPNNFI